ncbi:MAG: trypsin-like peptidase domain-containing protein [Anaerovoracaceae bacterium]
MQDFNLYQEEKKEQKSGISKKAVIGIVILSMIFSTLSSFILFNVLSGNTGNLNTVSQKKDGYTLEDATGSKKTVSEIAEQNKKSVVEIKTESVEQDPWLRQYVTQGAGSGVVVTEDGYIITNHHVIDGASKIYVTLSNNKTYDAKLIGSASSTDIAVLKIDAKKLTVATYGNSNQVNVGDLSVVIGNPLGELGGTVTAGIVSALDRDVTLDNQTLSLLQTDAAVNPGNSGGGMFNKEGQLIGIIVAKSQGSGVEGLGFAIPINTAAKVANEIIKTGKDEASSLKGTTYSGIQYAMGGDGGVYIQGLLEDNSKSSGLKVGDQVISIKGVAVKDTNTVAEVIKKCKPGDKIKYLISRNGKIMEFEVKLISRK